MDSDWSSLPPHLVDQILEKTISRINYKDFLQFSAVCTSWHLVTKQNKKLWQHAQSLRNHHIPFFLVPSEDSHYHSLYDVTTCSFLNSKLFVPFDKRFAGSSNGWLVSVDIDLSVTLHKPHYVSIEEPNRSIDVTISLPPLLPREEIHYYDDMPDYHVARTLITADPLMNKDECVVVVTFSFNDMLAYIRLAKDTKWSYVTNERLYFDEVVYFNSKFYALNHKGEAVSFEITESFNSEVPNLTLVANEVPNKLFENNYLVESNGKLLQILRYVNFACDMSSDDEENYSRHDMSSDIKENHSRTTYDVEVFELDFDSKNWVKLTNLGDVALFLGDNASVSVKASNFEGCEPNCIYFSHDKDGYVSSFTETVCDFGIFNLKNKTMTDYFKMNEHSRKQISKRVPIWITPLSH